IPGPTCQPKWGRKIYWGVSDLRHCKSIIAPKWGARRLGGSRPASGPGGGGPGRDLAETRKDPWPHGEQAADVALGRARQRAVEVREIAKFGREAVELALQYPVGGLRELGEAEIERFPLRMEQRLQE